MRFLLDALFAELHERIEDDCAEGCRADAAKREVSKVQRKVSATEYKRHGRDDEVAVVSEVNVIYNPDAGAGNGNQTENDDRSAAKDRLRNRLNDGAKLRREARTMAKQAATGKRSVE